MMDEKVAKLIAKLRSKFPKQLGSEPLMDDLEASLLDEEEPMDEESEEMPMPMDAEEVEEDEEDLM